MAETDSRVIERLLDEFVERLRRGESPPIAEYEARDPEHADQIREFFTAAQAIEQMAQRRQRDRGLAASPAKPVDHLGDFRIVREIGRGGMGIVYEAEQQSLGRRVAVKVLPQSALLKPRSLRRFEREARTAARLHHSNIIPVFGVGEHDGLHYIVMQLIRGVGLDKIVRQLAEDVARDGSIVKQRTARPTNDCTAVAQALVRGGFSGTRSVSDSLAVGSGSEAPPIKIAGLSSLPADQDAETDAAAQDPGQPSLGVPYWEIARRGWDSRRLEPCSTPTVEAPFTAISNRPTCCWTCRGWSGLATSDWQRSRRTTRRARRATSPAPSVTCARAVSWQGRGAERHLQPGVDSL